MGEKEEKMRLLLESNAGHILVVDPLIDKRNLDSPKDLIDKRNLDRPMDIRNLRRTIRGSILEAEGMDARSNVKKSLFSDDTDDMLQELQRLGVPVGDDDDS